MRSWMITCYAREVSIRKTEADRRRQGEDPDGGTGLGGVLNIQPKQQGCSCWSAFASTGVRGLDSIIVAPATQLFSRRFSLCTSEILTYRRHCVYSTGRKASSILHINSSWPGHRWHKGYIHNRSATLVETIGIRPTNEARACQVTAANDDSYFSFMK